MSEGTGHVLVTMDEELVEIAQQCAGEAGLELTVCMTTREAFRLTNRTTLQLLIVDFEIPDGGALAVVRLASRAYKGLPVILVAPEDLQKAWLDLFQPDAVVERPLAVFHLPRALSKVAKRLAADPNATSPPADHTPVPIRPIIERVRGVERRSSVHHRMATRSPRDVVRPKPTADRGAPSTPKALEPSFETGPNTAVELRYPTPMGHTTAGHAPKTHLDLKGNTALTPFSGLLYKLFANRLTGRLVFGVGEDTRTIYVLEGVPVWGTSRLGSECLCKHLQHLGLVGPEQIRQAQRLTDNTSDLGQVLMDQGAVDLEVLTKARADLVHEILLACFRADETDYQFTEEADWVGATPEVPLNPIAMISDAVHATMDPNAIAGHLNPMLGRYVTKTEKYAEFLRFFPATPDEWHWIDSIDGTRTLRELVIHSPGDTLSLLCMVHALNLADIVAFSTAPRRGNKRPPEKVPPAIDPAPTGMHLTADEATPEQQALVEAGVSHFLPLLDGRDPRALLSLPQRPAVADVRVAYQTAKSRLSPHLFHLLTPAVQRNGQRIYAALEHAYNVVLEELVNDLASIPDRLAPVPPEEQRRALERITAIGRERYSTGKPHGGQKPVSVEEAETHARSPVRDHELT